jgi:hypothetical protein
MREANWDIASHGLKWIDYKDFSHAGESTHMREAIRIHTKHEIGIPNGAVAAERAWQALKPVLEETLGGTPARRGSPLKHRISLYAYTPTTRKPSRQQNVRHSST